MPTSKLSAAEEIALGTFWRQSGFVDTQSPEFIRNSRYFQWRMNIAVLIAVGFAAMCLFNPSWLISHVQINSGDQEWMNTYISFRCAMGTTVLIAGAYCWLCV